jgi:hypothetical protein
MENFDFEYLCKFDFHTRKRLSYETGPKGQCVVKKYQR